MSLFVSWSCLSVMWLSVTLLCAVSMITVEAGSASEQVEFKSGQTQTSQENRSEVGGRFLSPQLGDVLQMPQGLSANQSGSASSLMEVLSEDSHRGYASGHGVRDADTLQRAMWSRQRTYSYPTPCRIHADDIQDCTCCIGDKLNQNRRGDLIYEGKIDIKEVRFNNWKDGELFEDYTYVWALGGRTPSIVCLDGHLHCTCKDEDAGWEEQDIGCGEGDYCFPRYPAYDPLAANPSATGAINKGLRTYSPMSDMTMLADEIHESCLVRGLYAAKYKSERLKSCATHVAHDGSDSYRRAFGSGSCSDIRLSQCGLFYARVGCEWVLCETKQVTRVCDAISRTGEDAKAKFEEYIKAYDGRIEFVRENPNTGEAIFVYFDTDASEEVDRTEFKKMCKMFDFQDCNKMWTSMDWDGSNSIGRMELILYFTNSHEIWDLPRDAYDTMMASADDNLNKYRKAREKKAKLAGEKKKPTFGVSTSAAQKSTPQSAKHADDGEDLHHDEEHKVHSKGFFDRDAD